MKKFLDIFDKFLVEFNEDFYKRYPTGSYEGKERNKSGIHEYKLNGELFIVFCMDRDRPTNSFWVTLSILDKSIEIMLDEEVSVDIVYDRLYLHLEFQMVDTIHKYMGKRYRIEKQLLLLAGG
jgi:hypothetical protein